MNIRNGILLAGAGVCALALGGCAANKAQVAAIAAAFGNANAIVGSGTFDSTNGESTVVSNASGDPVRAAAIAFTDGGAPGPSVEDRFSVTVQNGGAVAGPRVYKPDAGNSVGTAGVYSTSAGYSNFNVFTPEDLVADSILVAGGTTDSFAGFVGRSVAGTPPLRVGNLAAGYGGVAPTIMPVGHVGYSGDVVGVAQKVGEMSSFISGTSFVDADFATGLVSGGFEFNRNVPDTNNLTPYVGDLSLPGNQTFIGFTGAMSTSKAAFASTGVAFNGIPGSGQVLGGFHGVGYHEVSGALDVQDSGRGPDETKITGVFGAN